MDALLRRRMIASASGVVLPYITDGLVFRIDGKKTGGTTGTVTDIAGNKAFTNSGVTFSGGGLVFNGSSRFDTAAGYVLTASADMTVEICFRPGSVSTEQILFCSGNYRYDDLPSVALPNANIITLASSQSTSGSIAYSCPFVVDSPYIVSGNHTSGVINGQTATASSSGAYYAPGVTNRTTIGCRHGATASQYKTYFTGVIYAIRVYNRRLTEAEMIYNQAIDNERFNLGLTIQTT